MRTWRRPTEAGDLGRHEVVIVLILELQNAKFDRSLGAGVHFDNTVSGDPGSWINA